MNITKAGVYLQHAGRYVFVIGPNPAGDRLAIIRLGGHREGDESAWECAVRELREEAAVEIEPINPPATYLADQEWRLTPTAWEGVPVPICLIPTLTIAGGIAPIFLARTNDAPHPVDTAGLIFLTPDLVRRVSSGEIATVAQVRAEGGQVVFTRPVDESLRLKPFGHLHALVNLLNLHPELAGLPCA